MLWTVGAQADGVVRKPPHRPCVGGLGPPAGQVLGCGPGLGPTDIIPCLSSDAGHLRTLSSIIDTPDDAERTPWDELTTARQRVALTIAHVHGPTVFERPDLLDDAEDSDDLDTVIDDVDRVLTSLQYTTLLNELVADGYLVKERQGGKNPIILDLEFDEDRDEREVAPYGATSRLWDIVAQVLDREGLTESALDDVDEDDFNEVRDAVNRAVGRTVLVTVADASQYRFTKDAYPVVREKVES